MADDPIRSSRPDLNNNPAFKEPRTAGAERAASDGAEGTIGGQRRRSPFSIAVEELKRLIWPAERHRRLHLRLLGILGFSVILDLVAAGLLNNAEHFSASEDYSLGRAFAWTTSQMLVGGSSYPATSGHAHVAEVLLQAYGVFVIAAIAGAFASFFMEREA